MPIKRRRKSVKEQPAFKRLKQLISQPGPRDLLWYFRVGKEAEALCPVEAREYGKSQIDTLTEALGETKPFSQRLWNARRFFAAYNRNEVKALCQPKKNSQYRLAWGHLVRLLSLSRADRLKFQQECINGEWSSRKLGDRIQKYRGQKGRGGRRFERPGTLEDGLKQLIKESAGWQRRFDQVWFHPDHPAIDFDSNSASTSEMSELCGEAVKVLESIQAGIKQRLPELRRHVELKRKTRRKRK